MYRSKTVLIFCWVLTWLELTHPAYPSLSGKHYPGFHEIIKTTMRYNILFWKKFFLLPHVLKSWCPRVINTFLPHFIMSCDHVSMSSCSHVHVSSCLVLIFFVLYHPLNLTCIPGCSGTLAGWPLTWSTLTQRWPAASISALTLAMLRRSTSRGSTYRILYRYIYIYSVPSSHVKCTLYMHGIIYRGAHTGSPKNLRLGRRLGDF